jgi:hypothetical protein
MRFALSFTTDYWHSNTCNVRLTICFAFTRKNRWLMFTKYNPTQQSIHLLSLISKSDI